MIITTENTEDTTLNILQATIRRQQAEIVDLLKRDKSMGKRIFLERWACSYARSGVSEDRIKQAAGIYASIEEACKP